ncbi:2-succinyl-5-enolpyruvyl-6-hydroxy-3-cyclohexene-1-carboxylic-acid synthase [Corynebacterium sp. P7202]|uniref:2-succinyl-5-enolpyruvyl-6-hydroxy-3-cyclohexene-1-carboxylate synthase n=1 Tax=Corynebacterium pygosceleis TaxID=2800406 RepID=A0A9Q4C824_9CORY|nr:2-succinyl-5-enolpyruvyl-6-hydroxy-3-cyclohexene-1-carboxylic-acid synthase [Corynebacterium pygosceleis]MCK7637464.1 2-succinyl-5-enolpyruvyl-6-hydroxy-3-cyclohexene-1-carboxylic-acid synthase [Corynebacterium pygosceleis]MCX7445007.1 2-succinyl-5-enolpyruvyl-6-hydroxy-3-cyclohexene-1-carboxylic-acid synthase [Corynebacterium pygosceleis]MCX7468207.1 2-succinyl-5-enolpyruvyl-6-hydroxy-3-cyclohexene-1-carboxylic-acid synthase [Corynebacterium pygosceleis]
MTVPATTTAAVIAAELAAAGIRNVIVCPGSRSAPLALAVAARTDLTLHVRLDERSAAFLALGMARVDHRPAAVIVTSGTAVANCLPAMLEAHHSDLPLVVLAADRPSRLVGTGASQTIDQHGIFGASAVCVTVDAGAEPAHAAAVTRRALSHDRVHLNVAFDVPLVDPQPPTSAELPSGCPPRRRPHRDWGTAHLDLTRRTLVIAGDGAWPVEELAGVPTIAEPTAPAPDRPVHPAAAGLFTREQVSAEGHVLETRPEQLVVIGHPTLHRDVLALMSDPGIEVTVLTRSDGYTDPSGNAHRVASRVRVDGQPTKQWLKLCETAGQQAADAVREVLGEEELGFTGLHVAAAVADGLAVGDTLFVGASNPVRDMALVGLPFDGVSTHAPRGTAGIDGSVSQAVGVALATQSRDRTAPRAPRTVALLGDVTFLHDSGGLLISDGDPLPNNLTIVVANDDGGGIFETLEAGAPGLRGTFERVFGTPHGVDIARLAAAHGWEHRSVGNTADLIRELEESIELPHPPLIIEARTTRSTRRDLHSALSGRVVGR